MLNKSIINTEKKNPYINLYFILFGAGYLLKQIISTLQWISKIEFYVFTQSLIGWR